MFLFLDGVYPKLINPTYIAGIDIIPFTEDEDNEYYGYYNIVVVYRNGTFSALYKDLEYDVALARLRYLEEKFKQVFN